MARLRGNTIDTGSRLIRPVPIELYYIKVQQNLNIVHSRFIIESSGLSIVTKAILVHRHKQLEKNAKYKSYDKIT